MKIGIDLKPFSTGSKFRGIGMYTRNLLKELLKIDNDFEYYFINLYDKYDGDPVLSKKCFLYQYNMGPKIKDVGERQLFLNSATISVVKAAVQHFIEKSKIDAMLFTSPNEYGGMYEANWFDGIYKMAILYDLIPLNFPEQCLSDEVFKRDYYKSLEFLKQMNLLFAISQSAKDDAVRLLQIPEEKIVVIYAGIDSCYRKDSSINGALLKEKFGIQFPFMMYAGGIDFKKNIENLIIAYAKCGKKIVNKYQLVIVGKTDRAIIDKYYQIAEKYEVKNRIICTGFISEADLIALYNTTELFIFPSLYEGFGLPVIEAMACGAKVVTSNCSSLKEIADGHAVLVNPKSVRSIATGIKWVTRHKKEAQNLADVSVKYALSYSWENVAREFVNAIECKYKFFEKKAMTFAYQYEVHEAEIRAIARLYAENGYSFTDEIKEEIAEQLFMIENHQDIPNPISETVSD